jgi:hypothetical protein
MVTSVDAMVFLLPVMPLQGREPAFAKLAAAGTGVVALHVGLRACSRGASLNQAAGLADRAARD